MNITAKESDAIVALLQSVAKWGRAKYDTAFAVTVSVHDGDDGIGIVPSWMVHAYHKAYATGPTLISAIDALCAKCQPMELHASKMAELKKLERRAEELRKELAKIPKT